MKTCHAIGWRAATMMLSILLAMAPATTSTMAAPDGDARAYDVRLMRLSEILGAVHYLRELCEGKDGMRWRNAVNDLIKTEGTTALRRATIARRFNLGYRSYRRTYRKCTPSAKNTIARFFKEAIEISDGLVKLGQ
ncbi:MAG: TIGR02301 family protein [Hyphomicrobiaceae bacterium]